ncbi:portal protein [Gordonia phage Strosahl]|uniref:Portal protein n=4 Tax=Soupsvirus TaxID=1982562 RepID=A0A160DGK4_9CAUD|nr:portal protein [Gordonia phage KatherineG]YP_009281626.1 portal protein [Gordonia phage Remus]YP_009285956.1 portal protein [Gordonia phage JSwag]YP_009596216.1 portal protein [Gordonia phage Strosahl]YP_009624530.1 portal protein [Gordonia phage Waits]ASZ73892.1 portal protein [Gordonia phage ShayRa]AXH47813.1 portal protein [Gordonia phage LastResort]QDM56191.1 portal protein [Gordonia phage ReMo]QFP95080.1 portal protein [Gordonia phage MinecraftSteve]QLF84888.1 portal protein [Gordo
MTAPLPGTETAVNPDEAREEMISAFEDATQGLQVNTNYYDAERRPEAIGATVPREMQSLLAHVGYPRLYVDSIAERQVLEGFRLGGADEADEELWGWWQANSLDIEAPLGYTDAYIHGKSFITISQPDPQIDIGWDETVPIIRVEPPTRMHAEIDPRTNRVSKAIRVAYDAEGEEIQAATLYLPDGTYGWLKDEEGEWVPWFTVNHGLGIVPVVPLQNRTRLSDLYGTSEITPELRSMTDAASRILMLMQATAELMGVPQRLMFGVKPEEIGVDPETGQTMFDAYVARILAFEDGEGKAQQFSAAELANFVGALDSIAKQVAAYTGLPPQYLSTAADNPASAEAIRAAEARLVKKVERKNLMFGGAWEEVMRIGKQMMQGGSGEADPAMLRMETIWRDPSTPTYAAKADAASKLYNGGTGIIPRERARIDMGYSVRERDEMRKWDEEEAALGLGLVGTMYSGETPGPGPKAVEAPKAEPKPKEVTA